MKRIFFIFYIGLGFAITLGLPTQPWAQGAPGEDTADLAKKTQNPVSDLISLPFQYNLGFNVGPLFLSPSKSGKVIWGAGPIFSFPTATDEILGTEKWSAGISGVVLTMPGRWVIGALTNNLWSYARASDRGSVNQFLFQYFINYNFDEGWYFTSAPIRPETRISTLAELHANIQDAFNENGVQIMSPHYESDPAEKVWVPREKWFERPAKPEGGIKK